jgi:glycosyltransferase involved in cell wall biosynthesis
VILVCAESLKGGLGAIVIDQVSELQSNHQVTVLTPTPSKQPWVGHWELPPRLISGASIRAAWMLRRRVIADKPTALHFHGLRPAILGIAIGGRKIVTYHGSFQSAEIGRIRSAILRVLPLFFDEAFSVSPPPPRWRHTPVLSRNACSEVTTSNQLSVERRALPSRVVWAGRLDRPKRPDMLVNALGILRDSGLRFTAVIFGDGPQVGALEDQVRALGLEYQVTFAGHVEPSEMDMSARDVFVLLSESEGVPLSMQEAMASGCQVVVSPLSGTKWLGVSSAQFASSVGEAADAIADALSGRFWGDTRGQLVTRYGGRNAFETWHAALCVCGSRGES